MAITIVELLFYTLRDLELSNGGRPLFPGSDVELMSLEKCCDAHLAVPNTYIGFFTLILQSTQVRKVCSPLHKAFPNIA